MDISRVAVALHWGPEVIGRMKLDDRRWAYLVQAPFDMASDVANLVGTPVTLDNTLFEICGIVPKMPIGAVKAGEVIELLVRHRSGTVPDCDEARARAEARQENKTSTLRKAQAWPNPMH